MAFIDWSDEYSVNIDTFDEQHKQLINIINRVHEVVMSGAEKNVVRQIFVELAEYTSYHFRVEEEILEFHGYPELDKHRAQHERLVVQLLEMQMRFRKDQMNLAADMLNFLKNDWLLRHIVGTDKEYSSFLNARDVF